MKYKELEQNIIWIYHNEPAIWEKWARAMSDMWTEHYSETKARQKRRKRRQKGVEPASIEAVFEAICEVLEQNDFNKLLIHFKLSG